MCDCCKNGGSLCSACRHRVYSMFCQFWRTIHYGFQAEAE